MDAQEDQEFEEPKESEASEKSRNQKVLARRLAWIHRVHQN